MEGDHDESSVLSEELACVRQGDFEFVEFVIDGDSEGLEASFECIFSLFVGQGCFDGVGELLG